MNNMSREGSSVAGAKEVELLRLLYAGGNASRPRSSSRHERTLTASRVFELDARFESGGTWAGVDRLVEEAYLSLLKMEKDAIVEEHLFELYMVLLAYRDRIRPKFLCLTDTASPDEKTRFYPLNRAYRIVNGLVGLVLQWKKALPDRSPWVVIVRNFDHAQHLATLFFAELARRSGAEGEIDVIIATRHSCSDFVTRFPRMQVVPAEPWIADLEPEVAALDDTSEVQIKALESPSVDADDVPFERNYAKLLTYYRQHGDMLAAAKTALRILIIYASYGYYHEAKALLPTILPYFDGIVSNDEGRRMHYVSKINICYLMTGDSAAALNAVEELAAGCLTKPNLLADMHYIIGIHYLRYAEDKDVKRAENHLLRAVELIQAKNGDDSRRDPFKKVFIDNGLAFLRARQGRHQEALDLCRAGYEFLTKEMGENRHRLHRSVLQYNIAQVYVMLGRLEEGLEYYQKAILMDRNYSEYYNEAGNILQELGRYEEAIDHYLRAIACSAPYPEVFFNKAVCHVRQEELDDALVCFDTSLELDPDQAEGHALRADVLRELGRVDEALEGYDTAIALGYESMAVRVNRAVLHYNNGSYRLALADMDHVIDRDGRDASQYENRAAIYQAMEREDLYLRDLAAAERCREAA
jgi:tetratricopeptide (TPR) repeat protein